MDQQSLSIILDQPKNQVETTENDLPFLQMFRFAEKTDYILMMLGSFASFGAGCTAPLIIFLITQYNTSYHSSDADSKKSLGLNTMLGFVYLGLGGLACGWATVTLWLITGERQAAKCRQMYYASLLKQEIGFYDCCQQSQLHSQFLIDTQNFQGVIGQKFSLVLQIMGSFVCTIILSFMNGWLMTLVMLAVMPLLFTAMYFNIVSYQAKNKKFLGAYSKAGAQAQEAIASIKTVKQFNAQNFHASHYINEIKDTSTKKFITIIKIALSFGLLNAIIYWIYSLGMWFGANCVIGSSYCPKSSSGKYYTLQNAQIVFFTIVMTCYSLSGLSPAFNKIAVGKQAANRIFKVLDRNPVIKYNQNGLKLHDIKGIIQFRNVTFAYPKQKAKKILNNISMVFDVRSSALVGESGCGKSTIAQLLMRFYDPDEGEILLDGHNLKSLDLKWLRSKIGYVGQEPVLFATTIRQNLLYANPQATQQQIIDALQQAEVLNFINDNLEEGLQTYVGVGGNQVSGGQKQRIAIARALIKKPKILILDEATSALDRVNEKLIQTTLNKISEKMTTLTIAHRVGTIIHSQKIFVLANTRIQQSGRFDQLLFFNHKRFQSQRQIASTQNLTFKSIPDLDNDGKFPKVILKNKESKAYIQFQAQRNERLISNYEKGLKWRIFSYCKNKKIHLVAAICLSLGIGLLEPIFSIYVGTVVTAIFNLEANHNDEDAMNKVKFSSLAFFLIGVGALLLYLVQMTAGHLAGDEITANIREETFVKILKMPVKWFDKRENTSGALSRCLGHSCEVINELVTTYFFIVIQTISTTISGFTIAFVYQWKITLVALVLFPLIVLSGLIRSYFKSQLTKRVDQAHKLTTGMIVESLINIRTIYSFNMQNILVTKYQKSLKDPFSSLVKFGVYSGFMNGIGLISMNTIFGLLLYLGVIFMINYGVQLQNLLIAIFTCIFTGFQIGNKLNFMPDVTDATISAANIFNILDSQDEQQMQARENSQMLTKGFQCNIRFEDVSFKYQNRQQTVLKKISFSLKEGQKIAFVGPSGCGKSTIMQLLLRFYEPSSGKILINNIDIKDFDIKYLRRQFGVVSQEPTVFNTSFRQNIRYNNKEASEEDIREASRKANALEFIQGKEKLQQFDQIGTIRENNQGFDRVVGLKGLHISGGQKQRVAIARAILRNPKILLLDEATSALDAENERIVQESLDQIMKGKTSVTVAHRIQTIQNSDVINVINKGVIVEQGTYEQLTKMCGVFYQLQRGQKI